jgi:hypothetical protein
VANGLESLEPGINLHLRVISGIDGMEVGRVVIGIVKVDHDPIKL